VRNVTPAEDQLRKRLKNLNEKHTEAARRYFAAWPAEGNAVMAQHVREGERLVELLGVADLDALRALGKDPHASPDATLERKVQLATAANWCQVERGFFGGPLGVALSEFQPCPIAIEAEFDDIIGATTDQLRARPPVIISQAPDKDHPFAPIVLTADGYKKVDGPIGDGFGTVVASLEGNDPTSPAVRNLYRTYARELWKVVAPADAAAPSVQKQEHGPGQFADTVTLETFSEPPFIALNYATLAGPRQWDCPPDGLPQYRHVTKNSENIVSLGNQTEGETLESAYIAECQNALLTIADVETAYLYAACMFLEHRP
jgi:hypothetical protein